MINEKYKKKYLKYKKKYLKYKKNKVYGGGVWDWFKSCTSSPDKPDQDDCHDIDEIIRREGIKEARLTAKIMRDKFPDEKEGWWWDSKLDPGVPFILSLKTAVEGKELGEYEINVNVTENMHTYIINFISKEIVEQIKNDDPNLFSSYDFETYYRWLRDNQRKQLRGGQEVEFPPLQNWEESLFRSRNILNLDQEWIGWTLMEEHYSMVNAQLINKFSLNLGGVPISPPAFFNDIGEAPEGGATVINVLIDVDAYYMIQDFYNLRRTRIQAFTNLEDRIINYIGRFSDQGKYFLCAQLARKKKIQDEYQFLKAANLTGQTAESLAFYDLNNCRGWEEPRDVEGVGNWGEAWGDRHLCSGTDCLACIRQKYIDRGRSKREFEKVEGAARIGLGAKMKKGQVRFFKPYIWRGNHKTINQRLFPLEDAYGWNKGGPQLDEAEATTIRMIDQWSENIPAIKKYIEELCEETYNNIIDNKKPVDGHLTTKDKDW